MSADDLLRDDLLRAETDVAACRRARSQAEVLAQEIAAEQRVCQVLRTRLREEQADVDALEDTSIRSIVARLRGNRDQRIDAERAEVAAVELELAAHVDAVQRLTPGFEVARDHAQRLEACEQRLATALSERAAALAAHPEYAGRLADIDARLGAERAAFEQFRDAHTAALGAAGALDAAITPMSTARNLSAVDTFLDGGAIVSSLKRGELDGSVERLAAVHVSLLQLRPLLAGISDDVHHPNLAMPSAGVAMDVWFDNIFTDLRSHSRIASSVAELEKSRANITELVHQLEEYEAISRGRVERVTAERDALLRAAPPGG